MPHQPTEHNGRDHVDEAQFALNESAKYIYTELAEDYDRHQIEDVAYQTPEAVARQVAEFIERPVTVIDVGSGTGMVGSALVENGVNARITAVDLVAPMLREINSPAYVHRIVADAVRHLPIRSSAFDLAISAGLMEHVIDPGAFIPELLRIVRPGGLAVVAFAPNRRGRSDFLDQSGALLSHDALHTHAIIERLPAEILDRKIFDAYRDGGQWIQHQSYVLRRL